MGEGRLATTLPRPGFQLSVALCTIPGRKGASMHFGRFTLAIAALCFFSSSPVQSDDLETQRQALQLIRDMAADICPTVRREGSRKTAELSGDAKAKLGTVVGKMVDLGIDGAGKYASDEYQNVLQKDLAALIQSNSDCRLAVFRLLQDKMIGPLKLGPSGPSNLPDAKGSLATSSQVGRGVANQSYAVDVRTQLSDSIKVAGRYVKYEGYNGTASLVLENVGSVPFNAAIKAGSTSIGPCVGGEIGAAGLRLFNNSPGFRDNITFETAQTYISPNARIAITIKLNECVNPRMASVDVAATLTVSVEGKLFDLTVNALDVPIR